MNTNTTILQHQNTISMKIVTLLLATLISCSVFGQSFKKSICEHRKEYKEGFKEEGSPIKPEDIRYLRFFKPDEVYRVRATFTLTPDEKPFDMVTSSGKMKKYVKYGELSFDIKGDVHTLEVYQSIRLRAMPQYKDYLFIPFKDTTNGTTTYGAGRYLDVEIPDIQDGKLVLDFNKTYNPYCAFSDGYNCPRPPAANHLKIAIEAGEKNYAKK